MVEASVVSVVSMWEVLVDVSDWVGVGLAALVGQAADVGVAVGLGLTTNVEAVGVGLTAGVWLAVGVNADVPVCSQPLRVVVTLSSESATPSGAAQATAPAAAAASISRLAVLSKTVTAMMVLVLG